MDERTGLKHDYTRKHGVDGWEILAPKDSPEWVKDPNQLWNKVEATETRKDAQLARELDVAIPVELTHDQARGLVTGFVQKEMVSRGMVACLAFHHLDSDNPHAHIMLTMRKAFGGAFGPKERDWNAKELLEQWREQWGNSVNNALEKAGFDKRVDHRKLDTQAHEAEASGDFAKAIALTRAPQIHEGKTATAMKRCGTTADRAAINDTERSTYRTAMLDVLQRVTKENYMHTDNTPIPQPAQQQQRMSFADKLQLQRDNAPAKPTAPKPTVSKTPVKQGRGAVSGKLGHVRLDRSSSSQSKDKNELAKLEALEEWVNSLNKIIEKMISDSAQLHAQELRRVVNFERTDQHFRDPFIRQELQEIVATAKQFVADDTRFSRREERHARARARRVETKIELEREQEKDPKPSALRLQQNREWKKRREQREEKNRQMRDEERRAKRQLSPEKQAAYTAKTNETGAQLKAQIKAFEKRYPIAADQKLDMATQSGDANELTHDLNFDQQQKRKNRFGPKSP